MGKHFRSQTSQCSIAVALLLLILVACNTALAAAANPPEVLLGTSVGVKSEVTFTIFVKHAGSKSGDLSCRIPADMRLASAEKATVTGSKVSWKLTKGKDVAGPYQFTVAPARALKPGDQFRTVAEVRWGPKFSDRTFSNESLLVAVGHSPELVVVGTNHEAVASTAMVAAPHPLVAQAAIETLKKGGNAVDAAVAACFMLGVVDPMHSGLGGYGGFMVVYLAKTREVWVVDFNTVVPSKASTNMYEILPSQSGWWAVKDDANFTGYKAISVPGMLSGATSALQRFGSKPLKDVMAPAIDVADNGFKINSLIA
ncbi:MAG: gamma-glutamyltransferase, partial [Candidatus Korobacteraceae bacterium]